MIALCLNKVNIFLQKIIFLLSYPQFFPIVERKLTAEKSHFRVRFLEKLYKDNLTIELRHSHQARLHQMLRVLYFERERPLKDESLQGHMEGAPYSEHA